MADNKKELLNYIQAAFGSNAKYVEGLFERYQSDPKQVDEAWQEYFGELLDGGSDASSRHDGGADDGRARED